MSRTRVAWFVFVSSAICLVAPASQAQTSISLTFGSGTVGVYCGAQEVPATPPSGTAVLLGTGLFLFGGVLRREAMSG